MTDLFGPEEPVVVQAVVIRARSPREAVAAVAGRPGGVVFSLPARLRPWRRLRWERRERLERLEGLRKPPADVPPAQRPRKAPIRPAQPDQPARRTAVLR